MEGRQFGIGLAAGLLFALAIVAVSGVAAAPFSGTPGNGSSSYNSRTATTTAANSGAVFGVSTTSTAPVAPSVGNLTDSVGKTVSGGTNGQSSGSVPFTSSLEGMGQLSSLSLALVLAPVVVAILLGSLLYRLSQRSQEEPDRP
ncbi:MAG: hypothetical protein JRN06_04340 [Nitrososphaerota archaeon]|nr:hypothetical protein [Nitrososphaerota archaeon]MDG7023850.1 hypothetical protein [Nitrososphaerota archaeon]